MVPLFAPDLQIVDGTPRSLYLTFNVLIFIRNFVTCLKIQAVDGVNISFELFRNPL